MLEINVLDYIINIYISQSDNKRWLRLIIFYFRKMISAELNYEIYDKKLLVIIIMFSE